MAKSKAKKSKQTVLAAAAPAAPAGALIQVWEDDPEPAVLVQRPAPDISTGPLAFAIDTPAPAPQIYAPGTPEFRYWSGRRGAAAGRRFLDENYRTDAVASRPDAQRDPRRGRGSECLLRSQCAQFLPRAGRRRRGLFRREPRHCLPRDGPRGSGLAQAGAV